MRKIVDYGQADPQRVNKFLDEFMNLEEQNLDNCIRNATLSLADKIEIFKKLAPRRDFTTSEEELRMEHLLRSVVQQDLPLFKLALEYDGDYKDIVEYVFHDIDDKGCRDRIIEHLLRNAPQQIGVKVLSDVDDTMYANLLEQRYPRKTLYPGVLEFYDSLKREPFDLQGIPITTLSARPNPVAGALEEDSLNKLVEFAQEKTNRSLCPSALSGDIVSSAVGTWQSFLRGHLDRLLNHLPLGLLPLDLLSDEIPHGQEDKIGEVKFENFARFSQVYPEYRYVFVGDSGQADALTAQLMVTKESTEGTSRVITTFIHDLRQSEDDGKSASSAFQNLPVNIVISKASPTGRGVIVFRNYIDAAVIAYTHSESLENLITTEGLARITRGALEQFQKQKTDFQQAGKEKPRQRLRAQYRQDAEEAYTRLTAVTPKSSSLEQDTTAIRRILDGEF